MEKASMTGLGGRASPLSLLLDVEWRTELQGGAAPSPAPMGL
jgi:hypothetical protein